MPVPGGTDSRRMRPTARSCDGVGDLQLELDAVEHGRDPLGRSGATRRRRSGRLLRGRLGVRGRAAARPQRQEQEQAGGAHRRTVRRTRYASPVFANALYDGVIVAFGPTSPATASSVLRPSPVL